MLQCRQSFIIRVMARKESKDILEQALLLDRCLYYARLLGSSWSYPSKPFEAFSI